VDGCIVLFFGILGAIFVGVILFDARVSESGEERRSRVGQVSAARRIAAAPGAPRIDTEIHGCRVEVRLERDRESGLRYTRVVVDLRGRSPGMLKIAPPGWASRVARMFGDQDIVVGDRAFDDHFVIKASPVSLAHRIFSPERRARMVSAVRRIGRGWAPFVDLTRESLSVGVVAELHTERPLLDLMATARDFVEAILETAQAPGIEWVEGADPTIGECQVCGAELRAEVVLCVSCRTPHHEDCWRYTGECSTFACRETRYLRDGRTVRTPVRRMDEEAR